MSAFDSSSPLGTSMKSPALFSRWHFVEHAAGGCYSVALPRSASKDFACVHPSKPCRVGVGDIGRSLSVFLSRSSPWLMIDRRFCRCSIEDTSTLRFEVAFLFLNYSTIGMMNLNQIHPDHLSNALNSSMHFVVRTLHTVARELLGVPTSSENASLASNCFPGNFLQLATAPVRYQMSNAYIRYRILQTDQSLLYDVPYRTFARYRFWRTCRMIRKKILFIF